MGISDSKFHGFVGKAQKITEYDIAAAAQKLGTKWSRLHGVMEVEASFKRPGDGFDRVGRPKMLFEPHHFYRALQLRGKSSLLPKAVNLDIARQSQPPTSWYSNKSYYRLVQALELDEVGALVSCSWGFGQVMGFNWKAAGFQGVQDMVFACMDRESAHLQAMCGYIASVPNCLSGIRNGDASRFALGYNGSNYAAGGYHTKIAAAWRKWEKVPYPANDGRPSLSPAAPVSKPKTEPLSESNAVPSPTPEAVLPDSKPNLLSKSAWMNLLTVLAATPLGLKYLGGVDIPGLVEAFSAVGAVLLPIAATYFRATMSQPPAGSPLAKSISEAKVAAEQQAATCVPEENWGEHQDRAPEPEPQPPLDLMTAPIEDVVEQLPQFFERIQRIQSTLSTMNQARLPSPASADTHAAPDA